MHDIAEFLGGRDPFSGLDEAALDELAARTEVEFFAAGTTIYAHGDSPQAVVRAVRRGAVELLQDGRVVDRIEEGELFGHPSALSGRPASLEARAAEDTLAYALPASTVVPLLSGGPTPIPAASDPVILPAAKLIREPPLVLDREATLRQAAQAMVDQGASAALVRGGDNALGILTDRDLRARVVAAGLSADAPVTEAMSAPVVSVGPEVLGAEVLLRMLDRDVHHVPVLASSTEVLGVIATEDLVATESLEPFALRRAIGSAQGKRELRDAAAGLRETVVVLHSGQLATARVCEVISVVADALVRRMIELAIESEGPPPARFSWMTLGSHGRREAMPSSDVDSGMAWSEGADAAGYMHDLAEDVADCVRAVGWRLDPHGVTASGQFSASSIKDWRAAIDRWLSRPSDNRVLIATSILLDGRVIYGADPDLDVKPLLLERGDRADLLGWMLELALASKPPTGFLRDIVVEHSGEHRGMVDIKHGALLPVVDLARYAAFKARLDITSTVARVRAGAADGTFSDTQASVLEEAYELFSALRLDHQVSQIQTGDEPDDHLRPPDLSPLTRRHLRDAFREVAAIQRALAREPAAR